MILTQSYFVVSLLSNQYDKTMITTIEKIAIKTGGLDFLYQIDEYIKSLSYDLDGDGFSESLMSFDWEKDDLHIEIEGKVKHNLKSERTSIYGRIIVCYDGQIVDFTIDGMDENNYIQYIESFIN